MAFGSTGSGGGHVGVKIIAGVVTTVLGAGAVYFLGFHGGNMSPAEEMMFTKEATVSGWTSYVSAENIYKKNWNVLMDNYSHEGFQHYKTETLKEIGKFKADLNKIKVTKYLDKSFESLIEHRLEGIGQWENKYMTHLDNFETLIKETDQTQRTNKINDELDRFQKDIKDLDGRFRNEIENVSQTLNTKYNMRASPEDLIIFQKKTENADGNGKPKEDTEASVKQKLTGDWRIGTSWYIYQYSDGRLYMYFNRTDGYQDSVYGKWDYANNKIHHYSNYYFSAGTKWTYTLLEVLDNSFTMQAVDSPYTRHTVVRQ